MNLYLTLISSLCFSFYIAQIQAVDDSGSHFFSEQVQVNLLNMSDQEIYKSFDYLETACKLAQTIQNEEDRVPVCNCLQSYRNRLKAEYLAKNYEKFMDTAEGLYENIDEIVAECDTQMREKIAFCICEMMDNLNVDG